MDEIIQTPQTPENTQPENQQIAYSPPQINESSGGVKRIFNFISWTLLILLLPITALILLSQDTLPGDFFYPVKRGMENVILAAASVNPSTKAAFKTDLTETRFKEAAKLLVAKSDTTGLSDFIEEVQTTQIAVAAVSNSLQKKQLSDKLINKIDEYQNKLVQVQSQVQNNVIPATPQTTSQAPTVKQQTISPANQPTGQNIVSPTILTPSPTSIPIQTSASSTINNEVKIAIDQTQKKLEGIRSQLEEKGKLEKIEKGNSDNKKESSGNGNKEEKEKSGKD